MPDLPIFWLELAYLLSIAGFGLSAGCAWIAAIAAPNTSYDKLDPARADTHIRTLLRTVSAQVCVILLIASLLAFLAHTPVAGLFGLIAAAGFLTNRITLSRASTAGRVRDRSQARRVIAVSLTLVFLVVILVALGFAVRGL
jgi:hypothetical protein